MNATYPTERTEWSPVGAISQDAAEQCAQLFKQYYPEWTDRCDGRIARAVKICSTPGACKRMHTDNLDLYQVKSQSNPQGHYVVDVREKTCTCPDAGRDGSSTAICKHRLAIAFHLLGPQWIQDNQTNVIKDRYKLADLEDQRYELSEDFSLLAHQCRHDPAQRTEENRAEIIRILREAHKVQDQINAILSTQ